MGEATVPTVQVEKLRFGADWWRVGKGRVRARTRPARADSCPILLLGERDSFWELWVERGY